MSQYIVEKYDWSFEFFYLKSRNISVDCEHFRRAAILNSVSYLKKKKSSFKSDKKPLKDVMVQKDGNLISYWGRTSGR